MEKPLTENKTSDEAVVTPDGRYIVIAGRLWRRANPNLHQAQREELVWQLMEARRAVGSALSTQNTAAVRAARAGVDAAKVALGERGQVWWDDGSPDLNRYLVKNTPYAEWYLTFVGTSEP